MITVAGFSVTPVKALRILFTLVCGLAGTAALLWIAFVLHVKQ